MALVTLVALRCKCRPAKSVLCRFDDPRLRLTTRCASCHKPYLPAADAPNADWWNTCPDSALMREALALVGVPVSARKLRLGACFVCRTEFDWCRNPRFLDAVAAGEAFADGELTERDRQKAHEWLLGTPVRPDHANDWYSAGLMCVLPEKANGRAQGVRPTELPADWFRETYANPFEGGKFDPGWRTDNVVMLARAIVARRSFDLMPYLSDALMDAGCEDGRVIDHCRSTRPHARGCWVLDAILGRA
jgi:hypothetical protein